MNALRKTALHSFHINTLQASPMAEFAGYDMPIQYKNYGIVKEAELCRKFCSVFDVSHMGQARLVKNHSRKKSTRVFGESDRWRCRKSKTKFIEFVANFEQKCWNHRRYYFFQSRRIRVCL